MVCEQSFFGGWYRIDKYLENLRKIPMLDIRKKVKILQHTANLWSLLHDIFLLYNRMAPEMAAVERLGGYDLKVRMVLVIPSPSNVLESVRQWETKNLIAMVKGWKCVTYKKSCNIHNFWRGDNHSFCYKLPRVRHSLLEFVFHALSF